MKTILCYIVLYYIILYPIVLSTFRYSLEIKATLYSFDAQAYDKTRIIEINAVHYGAVRGKKLRNGP